MLRNQLLEILGHEIAGLTVSALGEKLGRLSSYPTQAVIETLLMFSPEVEYGDERWRLVRKSRTARILAVIESYADSTGKKIFRLSAALSSLPAHEHPTEEELQSALDASHGRFQLLANAMIKRNG